jgi:hypothetical protein
MEQNDNNKSTLNDQTDTVNSTETNAEENVVANTADTRKKSINTWVVVPIFILILILAVTSSYVLGERNKKTVTTSDSKSTQISPNSVPTITSLKSGYMQAKWGKNVTVSYTDDHLEYVSNGLPNHERQSEYALPNQGIIIPTAATATAGADPTRAQSYDYKITIKPVKAAKPTSTSLGVIGVMISGAALYNPFEGDNKTVAKSSNFTVKNKNGKDVAFLDSCNGHPNPMGQYHYHALPPCVTAQVDNPSQASHIIGIAFDGFAIYGDRDSNGKQITVADLDECNGITSATPEFTTPTYHYVLLETTTNRSSINCWSGTVDSSLMNMGPGMRM